MSVEITDEERKILTLLDSLLKKASVVQRIDPITARVEQFRRRHREEMGHGSD